MFSVAANAAGFACFFDGIIMRAFLKLHAGGAVTFIPPAEFRDISFIRPPHKIIIFAFGQSGIIYCRVASMAGIAVIVFNCVDAGLPLDRNRF